MGSTTLSEKSDWIGRLTGALPIERRRVIACFCSLFCLLTSYYLLKPLRNSQFLKEFPPEALPLFYLLVSLLSFTATKAFSYLYERLDNARLLVATFAIICTCKLFFVAGLLVGGKAISGLFFLWGSTYFLLALAAVWGCINELFRAEQGERCYGFIASGATLGCIAGSELASHLALRGSLALVISAGFMIVSLFFILMARRSAGEVLQEKKSRQRDSALGEIRTLLATPYLRGIAVMVLCLAIYSTGIDFISQGAMDRRLAQDVYAQSFGDLDKFLDHSPQGFEFIYQLREQLDADYSDDFSKFAVQHRLPPALAASLPEHYTHYREVLNGRTSSFFAATSLYYGLCGILVLTTMSRWLFQRFGVARVVQFMPIFSLVALIMFGLPIDLMMIQIVLVLGGTVNYSLNNATKEVLYTVTTTDEKYKIKPLIEGPVMRLGDTIAALVNLLCGALATLCSFSPQHRDKLFLFFCFVCALVWLRQVRTTGRLYSELRSEREPAPESK